MTEPPLSANRQSDLLTLLRSGQDWPTMKAALVKYSFAPAYSSEGVMDNVPPTIAPDSWDELNLATICGLIPQPQMMEVLAARYHGDANTQGAGDDGPKVTSPPDDRALW